MQPSLVNHRDMGLATKWVDAVVQLAKAHVYLLYRSLPVAAGRAELRRFRALVAIGARDAERGYARVAEGEDDVARRDFGAWPRRRDCGLYLRCGSWKRLALEVTRAMS
jgi:hypothetical protein